MRQHLFYIYSLILPISFILIFFQMQNSYLCFISYCAVILGEYCIFLFIVHVSSLLRYKFLKYFLGICFIIYIYIYVIQLISIIIYGNYIPSLAFHNLNNIEMILTAPIVLLTICTCAYVIYYCFLIKKFLPLIKINKKNLIFHVSLLCIGILLLLVFGGTSKFVDNQKIDGPLIAFTESYRKSKISPKSVFVINNIQIPNKDSKFWLKNQVYTSAIEFSVTPKQPNIIILVPDGIPARLINGYRKIWNTYLPEQDPLQNLTPNIDSIMQDALVIDNYFNHTAATYPGIAGMFTSSYPARGIYVNELKRMMKKERPMANFSTLFEILALNSYKTFFIDANNQEKQLSFLIQHILNVEHVYNNDNITRIYPNYNKQNYLTDNNVFESIKNILSMPNTQPKVIGAYFLGTHLNFNPLSAGGIGYQDGKNIFLNALHNFDHEFGKFLAWFKNSDYYDNTIIILTTDHTHFPDTEYRKLINDNPILGNPDSLYFCDQIPFIVYNAKGVPAYFNANGKTSLTFTPTILHFLNLKNFANAFMEGSVFDESSDTLHIYAEGIVNELCIKNNKVFNGAECKNEQEFKDKINKIATYQLLELEGILFDDNYLKPVK